MKRKIYITIFFIILAVVALRLAAPWIGKAYINHSLQTQLEDYTGSIVDLELFLIRGEYHLKGLEIFKKTSADVPFLSAKNTEVNTSWKQLLGGVLMMNVKVVGAEVNIFDSKTPEQKVTGTDKNWKQTIDSVVPLSIQSLAIEDSKIQFETRDVAGLKKVVLSEIDFNIKDLLQLGDMEGELAPFEGTGTLNGHALIRMTGGVNIAPEEQMIDLNLMVDRFDLETVNSVLIHYVPVNFTSGILTTFLEISGDTQNGSGYARVFFENLEVLHPDQDYKSGKHFLTEWAGGFGNWLVQSVTEGKVATEIPIQWKNGELQIDTSETAWNLLENSWDEIPAKFKDLDLKEQEP